MAGVIVGVLVEDTFYPTILDHNGAVAGLMKADGSGIEFMRTINALGVKENVSGNSSLERIIPFTYGKLIQISMLNGLVLQSKTRSYLAGTGEWASVDTAALWNPDLLLQNPGNWNAVEYASGDPVNKVDEKGTWSELAQMFNYDNFRQESDVYKEVATKMVDTYMKAIAAVNEFTGGNDLLRAGMGVEPLSGIEMRELNKNERIKAAGDLLISISGGKLLEEAGKIAKSTGALKAGAYSISEKQIGYAKGLSESVETTRSLKDIKEELNEK